MRVQADTHFCAVKSLIPHGTKKREDEQEDVLQKHTGRYWCHHSSAFPPVVGMKGFIGTAGTSERFYYFNTL